jgi:hypothetical protein
MSVNGKSALFERRLELVTAMKKQAFRWPSQAYKASNYVLPQIVQSLLSNKNKVRL